MVVARRAPLKGHMTPRDSGDLPTYWARDPFRPSTVAGSLTRFWFPLRSIKFFIGPASNREASKGYLFPDKWELCCSAADAVACDFAFQQSDSAEGVTWRHMRSTETGRWR